MVVQALCFVMHNFSKEFANSIAGFELVSPEMIEEAAPASGENPKPIVRINP